MNLKSILFNLSMILGFITISCNNSDNPGKTAENFLNAFNDRKYDEARKYASPETMKLIDLMENLSKMSTAVDTVKHTRIEAVSERINGDTAYVTFREKGSGDTDEIKLVKSGDKWLVHITKTDLSAKENSVFDTNTIAEPDSGEAGELDDVVSDTLENSNH